MARIPSEITQIRGCTCGGSVYHRWSEPRCDLLNLDDPDDMQARLDEADDRIRAYIDAKNAELRRILPGHVADTAPTEQPDR